MLDEEKDGSGDVSVFGRQIERMGQAAVGLLVLFCCYGDAFAKDETPKPDPMTTEGREAAPPGMVWIPGSEFIMGTDDVRSFPNERPAHKVQVEGFWMDEHDVTNAEFAEFVEATGYVTTAERKPDWEELKKELPPGTPKPDDSVLVVGSLVFTPTSHAVPLNDLSAWWRWVPGASWRHPEGPGSNIQGKENHPVVQVSWDDAVAYAKWAGAQRDQILLSGPRLNRRAPQQCQSLYRHFPEGWDAAGLWLLVALYLQSFSPLLVATTCRQLLPASASKRECRARSHLCARAASWGAAQDPLVRPPERRL